MSTEQQRAPYALPRAGDAERFTFQIVIHAVTAFQKHLFVDVISNWNSLFVLQIAYVH